MAKGPILTITAGTRGPPLPQDHQLIATAA